MVIIKTMLQDDSETVSVKAKIQRSEKKPKVMKESRNKSRERSQ